MKITVTTKKSAREYSVFLGAGAILRLADFTDLNRKVMIVTDRGVPSAYAKAVKEQCPDAFVLTVPSGEESKSFQTLAQILSTLLEHKFGRKDLLIAVGGGVVGDLTGFAAASYMRGIDFLNIPTTTLAQIDSSIGGKTAINLNGIKNSVGAFYQPIAVVADPDTLQTLPKRHFYNGMVEALKSGLIADKLLYAKFLQGELDKNRDEIIWRAMQVKAHVVMADEEEQGLRKILNFGHTIGHGIESAYHLSGLLHGEAVAAGMLPMIKDPALQAETAEIIRAMGINPYPEYDQDEVYEYITHDKKASGKKLSIITVTKPGLAAIEEIEMEQIKDYMEAAK